MRGYTKKIIFEMFKNSSPREIHSTGALRLGLLAPFSLDLIKDCRGTRNVVLLDLGEVGMLATDGTPASALAHLKSSLGEQLDVGESASPLASFAALRRSGVSDVGFLHGQLGIVSDDDVDGLELTVLELSCFDQKRFHGHQEILQKW